MIGKRFFGFIMLPFLGLAHLLERAFAPLFDLFKPDPLAFSSGPVSLFNAPGGFGGIAPALFNRNRHEAGVSRRSADRKN